jgi:hypothetical protein
MTHWKFVPHSVLFHCPETPKKWSTTDHMLPEFNTFLSGHTFEESGVH